MHSCVCVCNCRAMFTHCLSDIGLIPPCDRVVLEMEFAELCKWAVNKLRSSLLEIEQLCAGPQSDVDSSQQRLHKVSIHTHNTFHWHLLLLLLSALMHAPFHAPVLRPTSWPNARESCIIHRPLPIYQISLKSKKLFVDGRTDVRTDIFPPLKSRPKNKHYSITIG